MGGDGDNGLIVRQQGLGDVNISFFGKGLFSCRSFILQNISIFFSFFMYFHVFLD